MESKGRGKGRGSTRKEEMRKPDPEVLKRLKQEQEQVAANKSGSQSPTLSEQMADPPDEGFADAAKTKEADEAQELVQSPTTFQQTANSPADATMTTTGEGQRPPLAEELKRAVRSGVEVSTPSCPATVTINAKKLNPSATDFVPSVNSLQFLPSANTFPPTTSRSSPICTKHFTPTTTSSSISSRLNPTSKEFVPSNILPKNPPPSSQPMANGDMLDNGDFFDDDDTGGYLSVKDILGYERAAPTEADDMSSAPVLKGAAEMLLKVFNYPGSFDEIGKKFRVTLSNWAPSDSTLSNLAEMLVFWGVNIPNLRYAACRMCELLTDMEAGNKNGIGVNFSRALVIRLQYWHVKCYDKKMFTDEEKYMFACYSGIFAEIFSKIRPGNQPVGFMCPLIFKYVHTLLEMREDFFIREACNILKLTGSTLVSVADYEERMMADVIKKMNDLVLDRSLSHTSSSLLMQVVELSGSKWCSAAAPVQPTMSDAPSKKAGLNTNAEPFVPSDPMMLFSETFYDTPAVQPPVSCPADWEDFVGDDHTVELSNNSPDVVEEDDYDGLDPDIELEMEAFIDEIEEHLMLQDFDPELRQDSKPDGRH